MLDVLLLVKVTLIGALIAAVVMQLAAWGAPYFAAATPAGAGPLGGSTCRQRARRISGRIGHRSRICARFLTLIVPLTLTAETLAAMAPSRGLTWIVRLLLAAIVTPILLFNSVYLAALNGPNSAEWSAAQATMNLCGLAALLVLVWTMLTRLQSRDIDPKR